MKCRQIVNHVVVGVTVAVLASASHAITTYVDDDNCPGPGSGTELDPYCSIQTAIDNAVDTDEIVVAPGTYFETINLLGKAITVRSSDGADVTIIDAQETGSVVTCNSGEGPDTVLEGFTVTGGTGTSSWPYNIAGGGMYNYSSSPTVTNCTFSGNTADRGGGMFNHDSSPTVIDCTFSGNTAAEWGGGMFSSYSSPTVIDCTFSGNTATYGGGGVRNDYSSPTVTDCTFSGNTAAEWGGGGMCNRSGSPTVCDCTFSGNTACWGGGGMCDVGGYYSPSYPIVTDCTFSGNTAEYGGGMANCGSLFASYPIVTDCNFLDNWADVGGGGVYNGEYFGGGPGAYPTVTNCKFERNTAAGGNGGGILTELGNAAVNDSRFCENAPDHIWGDWDGGDNSFRMFCLPFPFDIRGDSGANDVLKPASR